MYKPRGYMFAKFGERKKSSFTRLFTELFILP